MTEPANQYDPAILLTRSAIAFAAVLIVFVGVIISIQYAQKGEANTESWAAMTGLIGWATSQLSIVFSNRFGTTQGSAKKDDVIAVQAQTAAVIAAAPTAPAPSPAPAVAPPGVPVAPIPPTTGSQP